MRVVPVPTWGFALLGLHENPEVRRAGKKKSSCWRACGEATGAPGYLIGIECQERAWEDLPSEERQKIKLLRVFEAICALS